MYFRICQTRPLQPALPCLIRQYLHIARGAPWLQPRQYWLHSFLRRPGWPGQAAKRSVENRPSSQGSGRSLLPLAAAAGASGSDATTASAAAGTAGCGCCSGGAASVAAAAVEGTPCEATSAGPSTAVPCESPEGSQSDPGCVALTLSYLALKCGMIGNSGQIESEGGDKWPTAAVSSKGRQARRQWQPPPSSQWALHHRKWLATMQAG